MKTDITIGGMRRSLGKLRLMCHFPGSDEAVLEALGSELADLCANDGELSELVRVLISSNESWPGISRIRETGRILRTEREINAAYRERRQHEEICTARPCSREWKVKYFIGIGSGWAEETLPCRPVGSPRETS